VPRETHRWTIDAIAEHVAAVEIDGGQVVRLPQWVLPIAAAEGQVLHVEHERDAEGNHSALRIEIDRAATTRAREASAAQVDAIRKDSARHDPGGDVSL
jgi:Protein of unknown function (DUF3006)